MVQRARPEILALLVCLEVRRIRAQLAQQAVLVMSAPREQRALLVARLVQGLRELQVQRVM